MEGDDSDGDEAGEGENLFKSRLAQRTGILKLDALKCSDSNSEFIPNISPSFGRANVYPSESHNGLSECNLPNYTEKNKLVMTTIHA